MANISLYDFASSNSSMENVTHVFKRHTWTQFLMLQSPMALMVDRVATPIWYVIGLIGNTISARIWLDPEMRRNNSSAIYLATLSITDLVFLLLHVLQELKYSWDVRSLSAPVVCEGYFMLSLCAQYLSPILVLAFTCERFIAIVFPFKKERLCSAERAVMVVFGLVLLCLGLSSMQAYLWTYQHSVCDIRPEALQGDDLSLWSVWTWSTEILVFIIVPVVNLVFNVLVIREVRRMSRTPGGVARPPCQSGSPSRATTLTLLSVSFYVILTVLPATIVYSISQDFGTGDPYMTDLAISQDPVWGRYITYVTFRKVIEELCLSHYACNIFLYLITGVHFRNAFRRLFSCNKCQSVRASGDTTYTEISQGNKWSNGKSTTQI